MTDRFWTAWKMQTWSDIHIYNSNKAHTRPLYFTQIFLLLYSWLRSFNKWDPAALSPRGRSAMFLYGTIPSIAELPLLLSTENWSMRHKEQRLVGRGQSPCWCPAQPRNSSEGLLLGVSACWFTSCRISTVGYSQQVLPCKGESWLTYQLTCLWIQGIKVLIFSGNVLHVWILLQGILFGVPVEEESNRTQL